MPNPNFVIGSTITTFQSFCTKSSALILSQIQYIHSQAERKE